jgi:hypothetical protein
MFTENELRIILGLYAFANKEGVSPSGDSKAERKLAEKILNILEEKFKGTNNE